MANVNDNWLIAKNLVCNGNSLAVDLELSLYSVRHRSYCDYCSRANDKFTSLSTTRQYNVNISVDYQLWFHIYCETSQKLNILYFVKFSKIRACDELMYDVNYHHHTNNTSVYKHFTVDDSWHLTDEVSIAPPTPNTNNTIFSVSLQVSVAAPATPLANIYDDTNHMDLELRGEDGSVHMHKMAAAISSPYLKRILNNEGQDKNNVTVIDVEAQKTTLQYLKDYIYKGILPDIGLEELLLLASCCEMPELEQRCAQKLLTNVSAQKGVELIMFAANNATSQLLFELLDRVKQGSLDVNEMRRYHKGLSRAPTSY